MPSERAGILGFVPFEEWRRVDSTAVEAYRYRPDQAVLQIVFVDGASAYDYPCSAALFADFLSAPSKGRFVNEVLKPHAEARGWTIASSAWTGW